MRTRSNVLLGVLLVSSALLISACATAPIGVVQRGEARTLKGVPVRITRISLSPVVVHKDVQVAAGSVWATAPGMMSQKTIRIDAKSNRVEEIPRPFTMSGADLLVDDHAMWLSDSLTKIAGSGGLSRIDLDGSRTVATVDAVGMPYATGNGAIWAYHRFTGVITGIDIKDNRIRTKIATKSGPFDGSIAFGAGSLWQLAFEGDVSSLQVSRGVITRSVVRRIDPRTGHVTAVVPLGPMFPTDQIRFVAGAVWVLGTRDESGVAAAMRVDAATNRVAATIPLARWYPCATRTAAKTPALWQGAVWVSTSCANIGRQPGDLLKIDLEKNEVTDELTLAPYAGPLNLAAGEGALWGFDGQSALRIDF